jgi:mannosyltransferase OCH1-like enzyme
MISVVVAVAAVFVVAVVVAVFCCGFTFLGPRDAPGSPVPKIIHQTAPEDRGTWPDVWGRYQITWQKKHPDFQYVLWTDEDLDHFMKTEYPEYYDMYTSYDVHIKRVDVARYFILYHYGGIYADMDTECVRRFYEHLPPGKVSVAESSWPGEKYQNALMASPRGHPLWPGVFEDLRANAPTCSSNGGGNSAVVHCTGPGCIERAIRGRPKGWTHTLPKDQYAGQYGKNRGLQEHQRKNMFVIHYNGGSWTSSSS